MDKKFRIGIDLGGTNTVFGIVDTDGNIICEDSIKTQSYPYIADFIDASIECMKPLIAQVGGIDVIAGMGIGAPNGNFNTGRLVAPPNLPWKGSTPLAQLFAERLATTYPTFNHSAFHVRLTNDANAAAMGEMKFGAARGMKDFVLITLGTGVGSGIVVNGQMVYGHDGFAGELGHVIVKRTNGRVCGCGRTGCLEAYCSATGVARTAREFLELRDDPSKLRDYDIETITSKDVYDCAMAGDKLAKEIFNYTGTILGEALADFTNFSSPEAFVLFGGLTKSGDLIMNPVKEAFERNVLGIYKGKVKILISELKESDAAVLGASALGWEVKN